MGHTDPAWLLLANGTALGRIDEAWVIRRADGALVDIEAEPIAGLILLERTPEQVVADLAAVNLRSDSADTLGFLEDFPLAPIVRLAAISDYWAALALAWAERAPSSPALADAVVEIEEAGRVSQRNRHRARSLRRQLASRDIPER
jgi:hypothetical protein